MNDIAEFVIVGCIFIFKISSAILSIAGLCLLFQLCSQITPPHFLIVTIWVSLIVSFFTGITAWAGLKHGI